MSRKFALAFVVVAASVTSGFAFPPLPTYVQDAYKPNAEYKPFFETVDALKSKCDVCHKPGADKKARGHGLNDFGKVYHDRFKPKDFQAAHKEKKTEDAMKLVKDAWEKSLLEKNADGKLYGDLIKEGKIPGKND